MGEACGQIEKMNAYRILVWKFLDKSPLGKLKKVWKFTINNDKKKITVIVEDGWNWCRIISVGRLWFQGRRNLELCCHTLVY
jgi:hypothetical protein